LLFIISGASFISKKIKEQGFLRKSHQKTFPWIRDPRSGIRKKFIPDPGGKKAPDPGSQIRIRIRNTDPELLFIIKISGHLSVQDPQSCVVYEPRTRTNLAPFYYPELRQ
jgi:hypothetical protein